MLCDVSETELTGGCSPQISEWVIATYLANQHFRKLPYPVRLRVIVGVLILRAVPQYYDSQKEKKWQKVHQDPVDSVGQRV
jgi:hypothetical protein